MIVEKWRVEAGTTSRRHRLGIFLQSYPRLLVAKDALRSNIVGVEKDGELLVL